MFGAGFMVKSSVGGKEKKKKEKQTVWSAGLEQCDNFELPTASLVARISDEILAPVASRCSA